MTTDTASTQNKLRAIELDMKHNHLDRDDEIHGLMLAAVAREHILFLGPPGLNKTRLAIDFASYFKDSEFFYWLMGAFTTPDEVFGALSLKAYKEEEKVKRIAANKLPVAHFAMLDEIYKASTAINNSLLHLMQERKYDDGGVEVDSPLNFIIAGSNELPADDDKLRALHDRFSLRYDTHYIQDDAVMDKLIDLFVNNRINFGIDNTISHQVEPVALEDLNDAQLAASKIEFHPDTKVSIMALWMTLNNNETNIIVSDRRWGKLVNLMQADAYIAGNSQVMPENMLVAKHMFWSDPSEKGEVFKLVSGCVDPDLSKASEIEESAVEILKEFRASKDSIAPGDVAQFLITIKELKEHLRGLKNTQSVQIVFNRVDAIFDELQLHLRG